MKPRIKKIIAREGLILLGIAILSSSFFYLAHLQNTWISGNSATDSSIENFDIERATEQEIVDYLSKKGKSPQQIHKILIDSKLMKMSDKQLYELSYLPKSKWPLFNKIDFKELGIFSLLLIYPLYLLVRFVTWAIGTLKKRD